MRINRETARAGGKRPQAHQKNSQRSVRGYMLASTPGGELAIAPSEWRWKVRLQVYGRDDEIAKHACFLLSECDYDYGSSSKQTETATEGDTEIQWYGYSIWRLTEILEVYRMLLPEIFETTTERLSSLIKRRLIPLKDFILISKYRSTGSPTEGVQRHAPICQEFD